MDTDLNFHYPGIDRLRSIFMQLRHIKSALPATEDLAKVTAITWSPNNRRLAVVTTDRIVHLFDASSGERKDKFSTKPAEKGAKDYMVRGLAFSPDSTKLAIAQSDNIVFVYKLGLEWGEKKSICNKFVQNHSVTCLTWPPSNPNTIVFATADGKVKAGNLRTNKPSTLYATSSYVVSLASASDGQAFVSGHVDCSIYKFVFDDLNAGGPTHVKLAIHSSIPSALSWGELSTTQSHVVAGGNDQRVVFYDAQDGGLMKTFDYQSMQSNKRENEEPQDDALDVGEFTVASFNPTGDAVVLGNFNRFFVYHWNLHQQDWAQVEIKSVENLYSVSALGWKPDGSRLAIGNLSGALDVYDACVRRYRYKGKFEFTYVSLSQVIIKRLSSGDRVVIKSQYGSEITKVNIFQDRFLMAHTPDTLLCGDLDSNKLSEIPWQSHGDERYIFENETCAIIFQAGELSLVEYGSNDILGSVRTEHMSAHLLSVRLNERPTLSERTGANSGQNKKVAYLLDLQTIHVKDLYSYAATTINHDCRVDWLELNARGNLVLFRDTRRQLHIFDVNTQIRSTLLHYCNYVQWVPESDVVVAQNRTNLYVWYNIRAPDQATIYPIKGDVEEIERVNGKTEVIVDEGMHTASYELDEALIAFSTALDDGELTSASAILEPLETRGETEAMWQQLSAESLRMENHRIGERCAAALGDIAGARFLHKVNKLVQNDPGAGENHWKVRARLAMLRKDFGSAEDIYISQGATELAIEMYQTLHKWEDAIRVAKDRQWPDLEVMQENYYTYLCESRQEVKAARLKESESDYLTAVQLYLKGNLPAKAAALILDRHLSPNLLEPVLEALAEAKNFEKMGECFERTKQEERALESYVKARAYRKAIDLARVVFPAQVVELEDQWGDYLVSQKMGELAISHYIEANESTKAVEAALNARQWTKASQLIENVDPEASRPYYLRLARQYQDTREFAEAEKCFLAADAAHQAVDMYTSLNMWDAAHHVALSYMTKDEVRELYLSQAQKMEGLENYRDAEKLYLTVSEPDLAIHMYKKLRKFDHMIRLVSKFRKDLLKDTHMHLAQQLEIEGQLRDAEHHYAESGEWQSAINMYRNNDQWDEAIRVAKFHGGMSASKRVAYAWAMSLGGEAGAKLLTRLGLVDQAIDYAVESQSFAFALELAESSQSTKLRDVHLKHALYLEDEERFGEAESEFIRANKPREAVEMYIHQHEWEHAMRIASNHDPSSMNDIYVAQAKVVLEQHPESSLGQAEELFVRGGKPELALSMYQDRGAWSDAIRLAKRHLPHKLGQVNQAHQRALALDQPKSEHQPQPQRHGKKTNATTDHKTLDEALAAGKLWESQHQYAQAIDAYLNVNDDAHQSQSSFAPEDLAEIWQNAIRLARAYEHTRVSDVLTKVARRFVQMDQHEWAVELYKELDEMPRAVECLIRAQKWNRAKELAKAYAPHYLAEIESARKSNSVQTPSSKGQHHRNVEGLIQKGDWSRALASAAASSDLESLSSVLSQRCQTLCEHDQVRSAMELLEQYDAPALESFVMTLNVVGRSLLAAKARLHQSPEFPKLVKAFVQMSFGFRQKMKKTLTAEGLDMLEKITMALHYTNVQFQVAASPFPELGAKIAMSLLRYITLMPADKGFYLAGIACKEQKMFSTAFVFLNRYLDLSEAIEDGADELLDNSDFVDTDIPAPDAFGIPKAQFIAEEDAREEVRDWVLALSMDQQIQESLPESECTQCSSSGYEGTLECAQCHAKSEACIITGMPIAPQSIVNCTECHVVADRENWNKWTKEYATCPWCTSPQKMSY